jgi:hypothetical protein
MSKRLPYFQFEPAEYLAGDIMFCSYGAQGMFNNICALYWQKDCDLKHSQVVKRLKNEDLIKELVIENIIKVLDDKIIINFLDEQFSKATDKSSVNSENGKKGALKRWRKNSPAISESIATPLIRYSESIALREDKIREDKRREENIINNTVFFDECKTSSQWLEVTAMKNKVKTDVIILFLGNFENHLVVMEEQKKSLKEVKEHFTHWLNKQDLSNFREKIFGKTNQI